MVWNWEDPGELWEGKLHPGQLLVNGKRKHQSGKPGVEVSGCGFKSSTVLEPATRELSWGDWVSLQSSSKGMPLRLGMHCLFTAGPEMMTLGKRNGGAWRVGGEVRGTTHLFVRPLAEHFTVLCTYSIVYSLYYVPVVYVLPRKGTWDSMGPQTVGFPL